MAGVVVGEVGDRMMRRLHWTIVTMDLINGIGGGLHCGWRCHRPSRRQGGVWDGDDYHGNKNNDELTMVVFGRWWRTNGSVQ